MGQRLPDIPLSGAAPKQLTKGPHEDLDPVFSPNGRWLAVVSTRSQGSRRDRNMAGTRETVRHRAN